MSFCTADNRRAAPAAGAARAFLAAGLAASALLAATASASAATIVRNALGARGDFEYDAGNGLGEGWSPGGDAGARAITPALDSSSSTSGSFSQRLSIALSPGPGAFSASALLGCGGQSQLQVGDTLAFSADLKTSPSLTSVSYNLTLRFLDANFNQILQTDLFPASGTPLPSWTHGSINLTVPSGTAYVNPKLWVSAIRPGASGTVWLDNVVVSNGLTAQIPAPRNRSIRTALTAYVPDTAYDWYDVASHFDTVILSTSCADIVHTLKLYNPTIQVYAYTMGTFLESQPGQRASPIDFNTASASHPDWFLTDILGNRQVSLFYSTEFAADVGNAGYQQAWANAITPAWLGSGAWDGLFMDAVMWHYLWMLNGYSSKYPDDTSWDTAMAGFLQAVCPALHAKGLKCIGNFGHSDWRIFPFSSWMQSLDGGYDENAFFKWNWSQLGVYVGQDTWTQEVSSPATVPGKADILQAQVATSDTGKLRFALASYLLAANDSSCFATTANNYRAWQWSSDLETPIGQPTGTLQDYGTGLYTRAYSNGLVVANTDPVSMHTTNLAQAYKDQDGVVWGPGSITVQPVQGLILLPQGGGGSVDTAVINGGASTAYSTAVTLNLSAGSAAKVAVRNPSDGSYTYFLYAASIPWTLTAGSGTKVVYVHFIDASSTWGPLLQPSISLSVPLTGTATINGGASTTNSQNVTLNLSAIGAAKVAVRNPSDGSYTYFPYAASIPWTLPAGTGSKVVYIHFIDPSSTWGPLLQPSIVVSP